MALQYYNFEVFLDNVEPGLQDLDITLMSTDTYSDAEVHEAINKTGKMKELCASSIQMSVVGFGNKVYGKVKLKGEEIDIKKLFDQTGVVYSYDLGSKLEKGQLTPRRLQRFFRYKIKMFLEGHKDVQTYLFKKYSTHNEKFHAVCFPGAEHLIEIKEEAQYLYHCYCILDLRLGLNIRERIARVFQARGVMTFKDFKIMEDIFAQFEDSHSDFSKFLSHFLSSPDL